MVLFYALMQMLLTKFVPNSTTEGAVPAAIFKILMPN